MLLTIKIHGVLHEVQADSGSDVDILPTNLFHKLENTLKEKIPLKPVTKTYRAANRTLITFRGFFPCSIASASNSINTKIYVMDLPAGASPILGEKSLLALGLIKYNIDGGFVQSVSTFTKPKVCCTDPHIVSKVDAIHNKYKKLFSGIGCLKNYEIDLKLADGVQPFYHRAAPVPIHLKEAATKRIKEFVEAGLYVPVPTNTPLKYVSALLVLDKGKGKVRLVGNYVPLNKYLYRSMYIPAPRVENFLDTMRGANYFAKIDLNNFYGQFKLSPQSQKLCTLSTHLGNFYPTTLQHGIKSAGDFADERLNCILAHCQNIVINRDDIMIGSSSLLSLVNSYELVLSALHENNLTVDPNKCFFGLTTVRYYGYIWDKDGMRPDSDKIRCLKLSQPPQSQDGLTSFLCMAMWNSRFIHRFSEIALPLRNLALTSGPMCWTNEHYAAFQSLKDSICENTLNNYFVKGRPVQLHCDAGKRAYSDHATSTPGALSAVLSQYDTDKKVYLPIQFASQTLNKIQVNFSQIELESLSLAFGMNKFRIFLSGAPQFIAYTDAKPLVSLWNRCPPSVPPRILRHILSVQDLDYNVQYKSGKLNIADFCSRNPIPESNDPETFNPNPDLSLITDDLERFENRLIQTIREHPEAVTMNVIREATLFDSDLQFLLERMRRGDWKKYKKDSRISPYRSIIHELSEIDSIIFRGSSIIILPMTLYDSVVLKYHLIGHSGVSRLASLIKQNFYWPGMINTIQLVVQSCKLCGQTKIDKRKEPYSIRPTPKRIFEEVTVDYKSVPNGWQILVFLCTLSRFPDIAFVKSTSFEDARLPFIKFQATYGTPVSYRSDGGSPFSSGAFKAFMNESGAFHHTNTPLHPQSLGELERLNSVIDKAYQRSQIEDKSRWKEIIINAIKSYRMTPHPVLGKSPYEIVFKKKMNAGVVSSVPEIFDEMDSARKMELSVSEKLYLSKLERKKRFEQGHNVKPHQLRVGDKVWVLLKMDSKTKKRYEKDLHQIVSINYSKITAVNLNNNKSITRHANHFKLFIQPYDLPIAEATPPNLVEEKDEIEEEEEGQLEFSPGNPNPAPLNANVNPQNAQQPRIQRNVRFHPQDRVREFDPQSRVHTRSQGPAPIIPHVLNAPLENSAVARRDIIDIHNQHEQQQQQQQPPNN